MAREERELGGGPWTVLTKNLGTDATLGQQLVDLGEIIAPALLDFDVAAVDARPTASVIIGANLGLDLSSRGPWRTSTHIRR
jgi:hypothetical protein